MNRIKYFFHAVRYIQSCVSGEAIRVLYGGFRFAISFAMSKSAKSNLKFALFILMLVAGHTLYAAAKNGVAGAFCGKVPVIGDVDSGAINNTLDLLSSAPRLGKKIVKCNIPGDSFQICRKCQDEISKEQMDVIRPMVASYDHRMWHDSWHLVVGYLMDVENLDPRRLEKAKSRNLLPLENAKDFLRSIAKTKGESFLYMHRQMIKMTNLELTANALPCVQSWTRFPDYKDPLWAAPLAKLSRFREFEGNHSSIVAEADRVSGLNYLKSVSLNQLGDDVQSMLHSAMHLYFAEDTLDRCDGDEFKSATCDDLTSNASSQVNLYFWKIHTFLDSFVGKWLAANGYRMISEDCTDKNACYQWKGTYLGPIPR